jgi:hypothetical protein
MKKQLIITLILIAQQSVFAQVNVINSTDGSLTITPKGIRGKEPTSTSVDALNIAIGVGALKNNVNAGSNIAIGRNALSDLSYQNPSANYLIFNLAIGENALRQLQPTTGTNAYSNIALGFNAMANKLRGNGNVAVGNGALIGKLANLGNNIASYNTAIGDGSGRDLSDGSFNVIVGNWAGYGIETGSRNILIGSNLSFGGSIISTLPSSYSNKLEIFNSPTNPSLIKGDFSTSEVKINSKLKVGGTSDIPSATLHVEGNIIVSGKVAMTSSQNDFNLNGKSIIKVSGGGTYNLTGIAGGEDGMIVYVWVEAGTTLNILDQNVSSLTGNRIFTGSGNTTISDGGHGTFMYDTDSNVWRVMNVRL